MADPASHTTSIARENFLRNEALTGLGRDWDDLSDEDRERWVNAGVCVTCGEPLERDEVFMSTLDGHWFCSLPCRNTFWEMRALRRCAECFDDGQDTDVRRQMLDRLVALGWLNQTGRGRWEIGFEGARLLRDVETHG